uniref:glucuronosyltransferase n=1 Tax=Plectus sambesii TaxID=2011161 RepID=A0A914V172_9BILA
MVLRSTLLVICWLFFQPTSSYRILVYSPTVSKSHVISNTRIAETLAKAGHDVVLYLPEYDKESGNIGSTLAKQIKLDVGENKFADLLKFNEEYVFSPSAFGTIKHFLQIPVTLTAICESIALNTKAMDELRSYKFDVAIFEQLDLCGAGIVHLLGIPSRIWLSSQSMMEQMSFFVGVPEPLSYVPASAEADLSDRMTYSQRCQNILIASISLAFHYYMATTTTNMFRRNFGADFPHLDKIAGDSALIFVNSEEFLDFPRPILHKTVYVGGLGLKESKPLDEKYEKLMNIGRKGTVLVSLGSIVKTSGMPMPLKEQLFAAFTHFPDYYFLFKIDKADSVSKELAKGAKNVQVVEWMPQVDLLGHKNMKVFITHGGLNGVMEAAYAGVPMITVGMFADQYRNGRAAERNGYGYSLSKKNLTTESVSTALNTVLDNESYKKNALRISRIMRTKPFRAEDRVVEWTQFLAEFKQLPELEVVGRDMGFIQYFCLDIFVPLLIILILIAFVQIKISLALIHCIYRRYSRAVFKVKPE